MVVDGDKWAFYVAMLCILRWEKFKLNPYVENN